MLPPNDFMRIHPMHFGLARAIVRSQKLSWQERGSVGWYFIKKAWMAQAQAIMHVVLASFTTPPYLCFFLVNTAGALLSGRLTWKRMQVLVRTYSRPWKDAVHAGLWQRIGLQCLVSSIAPLSCAENSYGDHRTFRLFRICDLMLSAVDAYDALMRQLGFSKLKRDVQFFLKYQSID